MSHTTSSARRAQRLLLETTLFQEETSLPRLQALLTTLEDQQPPAFSAEASWRQLQATHPDCFPFAAPAWRRWALAGPPRPGRPGPPSPRPDKGEHRPGPRPFPGRRLPGYPHVCRFGGAV